MAFSINTKDGRISVWRDGVSNCCYHPIPDDVAKGVGDGTIKWQDVVNAINKKRYMDKDFDWTSLREHEEQLNVRTSKFDFADEGNKQPETAANDVKNAISMEDVVSSAEGEHEVSSSMIEGKKSTAKRARASSKSDSPDIFDDGAPEEAK